MIITKLKEILIYKDELVTLKDNKEYITIKVKRRFGGLEERDRLLGKKILTKKQYKLHPHSFIISRVQCWHQAYTIVPDNIPDNMIASINYDQFEISPKVDIRFFWWLANSNLFTHLIRSCASGIVIEKMVFDRNAFLEKEILLPPLDEQFTISTKIDRIYKEYVAINSKIEANLLLASKFRQAILQEAVQGKLTTQSKNDEHAEFLLQRIKDKKQKLVAEGKLNKGKIVPPIANDSIPFQLPHGWVWCRLGEIIYDLKYGTSQKCDYKKAKHAVLRIPNILNGQITLSDLKFTNLPEDEFSSLKLERDDILVIRSNGSENLVGRTAVFKGAEFECAYAGYLVRLRFDKHLICSDYIHQALESFYIRQLIESPLRTTSGVKNINSTEISNLLIPLPSLSEQRRVVIKVEQLMQMVNQLEKQVQQSQTKASQLLQAVLKEAFTNKGKVYEEDVMITMAAEK